jgi:hypothetical protein
MTKTTTLDAIKRYADDGVPTGDFLYAVLTNNLVDSIGRADRENLAALPEIVNYIYNNIPGRSWGSPEKVDSWLKEKYEEWQNKSREVLG